MPVKNDYQPRIDPWFDLVSALPLQLGNSLLTHAENYHGAPYYYKSNLNPDKDSNNFKDWAYDLAFHGRNLVFWARNADSYLITDDGYDEALEAAKDALRWVAEYLEHMWD